ncbi:protein FAR1-RELATED SEQUENCE 5-like [Olea europaea var. sylvestris]|uniref:protein FAR1-RELATED SEQUENCE 5-like n=1 Tax=Olea europaea var. sylvestris TaxID=158386 RepID=UPI000C1D6A0B|nr:protein FAR1-RELATED SEQUENCE 5-like [Olea europaea var. sylvestris]
MTQLAKINSSTRQVLVKKRELKNLEINHGALKEDKNMEDVSFVESKNENVDNNVNVVGEEIIGRDDCIVPEVGMQFNDEKEVYDFYARYAYAMGFPSRKRSSTKDDDGVLRYVTLTYSREGRRNSDTSTSLKLQPTIQTGCKARISASFDIHGYWKINTVHLDHNHKTSPTKSRLYRCNQELSAQVKRNLEVNDMADNRCRQAYKEFGDVVTFDTTYLTNKYDMPFAPFVGVNHHG